MKYLAFLLCLAVAGPSWAAWTSKNYVISVTGSTVPPGAQAAGFTTLASNFDFTQSLPANWLGCKPYDGNAHQWYQNNLNYGLPACANISQVFDSVASSNVLDIPWLASYPTANGQWSKNGMVTCEGGWDYCTGAGLPPVTQVDYPNAYFEVVFRVQTTPEMSPQPPGHNLPGSMQAFWMLPSNCCGGFSGWETDIAETWNHYSGCADQNIIDHDSSGGGTGWLLNIAPCANLDSSVYHTWAVRVTQNSSGNMGWCGYIDGTITGCHGGISGTVEKTQRNYLIFWNGIGCNFDNQTGLSGGPYTDCVNRPITSVSNCAGAVCVSANVNVNSYVSGMNMYISGVTGSGAGNVNGSWTVTQNSGGNWKLNGSTWPSGGSPAGGTINPYSKVDMFVKSVRVWSCASWQTTMCYGTPLTSAP